MGNHALSGILLVGLSGLPACGPRSTPHQPAGADDGATAAAEADLPPSIGEAWMEDDGSIVLMLRAEEDDGSIGDALFRFPPSDPRYQEYLDHVGGLVPGQHKPCPPWPE